METYHLILGLVAALSLGIGRSIYTNWRYLQKQEKLEKESK